MRKKEREREARERAAAKERSMVDRTDRTTVLRGAINSHRSCVLLSSGDSLASFSPKQHHSTHRTSGGSLQFCGPPPRAAKRRVAAPACGALPLGWHWRRCWPLPCRARCSPREGLRCREPHLTLMVLDSPCTHSSLPTGLPACWEGTTESICRRSAAWHA